MPELDQIINYAKDQFTNNQFFTGMFFTGIVAMAWSTLRSVPRKLWNWFISRFTTYADINSDDDMFFYFSKWLSSQDFSKRNRIFNIKSILTWNQGKDCNEPSFIFTVGYARYLFRCNGKLTIITKGKEEGSAGNSGGGGISSDVASFLKRDSISIRYFGRNLGFVQQIMDQVCELYRERESKKLSIKLESYGDWHTHKQLEKFNMNNICLKEGVLQTIINDIEEFSQKESFYADRGIPYHRGYLFYGPPGTGKTTLATALASFMGKPLYCLNLGGIDGDRLLLRLIREVEPGAIILMEDVDCIFRDREEDNQGDGVTAKSRITLSTFLNCLDGVNASEKSTVIMTTNHIETLDSALIRPGRIDMKVELNECDKFQAHSLFMKFYDDEDGACRFATNFEKGKHSPATVQSYMISNSDSKDAIENMHSMETYK